MVTKINKILYYILIISPYNNIFLSLYLDPPPYNQSNPPYPSGPGYQMPPNPSQSQWGNPGFQQAPYSSPPGVGFQVPLPQPHGFNVPLPPAQSAYDPNKPPYLDSDNFVSGMGFDDKSIRQGFIRRVYSILSV